MPLHAQARRNGGPLASIYGAYRDGERVHAGLLLVQAGLTRRRLTFVDAETKEKLILKLPKTALNLRKHANATRVWLEVV